jgi:uncharacterized OB-fold protein
LSNDVHDNTPWALDERGPYLIGGRRLSDGEVVFPYPGDGTEYERVRLPGRGTLWSFTVQRFCPKAPFVGADRADFAPYAVGYVELPEVIVETRIQTSDFESLRLGDDMRLVIEEICAGAGAATVHSYAFRPFRNGAPG